MMHRHLIRNGEYVTDPTLISRIGVFLFRFLQNSYDLFVLMGIASIVAGSVQMIKRYRVVIGTVVFLLLGGAFLIGMSVFLRFMDGIFNSSAVRSFFTDGHVMLISVAIFMFTVMILTGVAGIYLGFFLFEKFSEV